IAGIALRKDRCRSAIFDDFFRDVRRIQKRLGGKRRPNVTCPGGLPDGPGFVRLPFDWDPAHSSLRVILSQQRPHVTPRLRLYSCRITPRSELLIVSAGPGSIKPSRLNFFRKNPTLERLVPAICASLACVIRGRTLAG